MLCFLQSKGENSGLRDFKVDSDFRLRLLQMRKRRLLIRRNRELEIGMESSAAGRFERTAGQEPATVMGRAGADHRFSRLHLYGPRIRSQLCRRHHRAIRKIPELQNHFRPGCKQEQKGYTKAMPEGRKQGILLGYPPQERAERPFDQGVNGLYIYAVDEELQQALLAAGKGGTIDGYNG